MYRLRGSLNLCAGNIVPSSHLHLQHRLGTLGRIYEAGSGSCQGCVPSCPNLVSVFVNCENQFSSDSLISRSLSQAKHDELMVEEGSQNKHEYSIEIKCCWGDF